MRRTAAIVAAGVSLAVFAATPAFGDHTARRGDVPEAACNQGTENAHGAIPESAPSHERVPHSHAPSTDCVHLVGHSE